MIKIISGIILAAGSSKRMGRQKLLLPFKDSTIVENVIETVKDSKSFREILIVYSSSEVLNMIKQYDAKTVYNAKAEEGLSTSVIKGVSSSCKAAEAYMFIMGDQPLITKEIIEELINIWRLNQNSIIVPRYKGKNGMPAIFPVSFRKELMSVTGDAGGRSIIKSNPDKVIFVDFCGIPAGFDIDTPEEYQEMLKYI